MNVEMGAEAAQFPQKEYIKGIAVAVCYLSRAGGLKMRGNGGNGGNGGKRAEAVYSQAESEASLWDYNKRLSVKYRKLCMAGALRFYRCLPFFYLQTGGMSKPRTTFLITLCLPSCLRPRYLTSPPFRRSIFS